MSNYFSRMQNVLPPFITTGIAYFSNGLVSDEKHKGISVSTSPPLTRVEYPQAFSRSPSPIEKKHLEAIEESDEEDGDVEMASGDPAATLVEESISSLSLSVPRPKVHFADHDDYLMPDSPLIHSRSTSPAFPDWEEPMFPLPDWEEDQKTFEEKLVVVAPKPSFDMKLRKRVVSKDYISRVEKLGYRPKNYDPSARSTFPAASIPLPAPLLPEIDAVEVKIEEPEVAVAPLFKFPPRSTVNDNYIHEGVSPVLFLDVEGEKYRKLDIFNIAAYEHGAFLIDNRTSEIVRFDCKGVEDGRITVPNGATPCSLATPREHGHGSAVQFLYIACQEPHGVYKVSIDNRDEETQWFPLDSRPTKIAMHNYFVFYIYFRFDSAIGRFASHSGNLLKLQHIETRTSFPEFMEVYEGNVMVLHSNSAKVSIFCGIKGTLLDVIDFSYLKDYPGYLGHLTSISYAGDNWMVCPAGVKHLTVPKTGLSDFVPENGFAISETNFYGSGGYSVVQRGYIKTEVFAISLNFGKIYKFSNLSNK